MSDPKPPSVSRVLESISQVRGEQHQEQDQGSLGTTDMGNATAPPSTPINEATRLLAEITPGEWVARIDHRAWDESVHYMVGTADQKRFIAWMCGSLGEATRNQWNDAQKQSGGWRSDPSIKADAEFIAAAPRLLRWFIAQHAASQSALATLRTELEEAKATIEMLRSLEKSTSPCGHWSQLAHTYDGGKTINCWACEVSTLTAQVRALEGERDLGLKVIRELRQKLALAGVEGSPPGIPTLMDQLHAFEGEQAQMREALEEAIDAYAMVTAHDHHGIIDRELCKACDRQLALLMKWKAALSNPAPEGTPSAESRLQGLTEALPELIAAAQRHADNDHHWRATDGPAYFAENLARSENRAKLRGVIAKARAALSGAPRQEEQDKSHPEKKA